jgi:hypothetical protein
VKEILKLGILMLLLATHAVQADFLIDSSCLQGFVVGENKRITPPWADENLSCKQMELLREQIYIDNLAELIGEPTSEQIYESLVLNLDRSIQELDDISRIIGDKGEELDRQQIEVLINAQMANAGVAAGIIACAETLGGGCVFSGVSAVWGLYSAYRNFASIAQLNEEIEMQREKLVGLRKVVSDTKRKLPQGLEASVEEFNNLCQMVRSQCM